ncbi:hypothetical protein L6164_022880 [Bauhinia variegata]|uniref:Uncharacterized protein n=1 Tax=Bauhinia variegata TaxID=167791 RepID=A0ACB9MGJ9_BAUVA|nr:hypothetical protein L6164_022880 [Bauhinia variegata]
METRGGYFRLRMGTSIVFLYLTLSTSLIHCDAERTTRPFKGPRHKRSLIDKQPKKLKTTKHFHVNPTLFLANVVNPTLDSSNAQPYSVSSPNSLPPYESLAPIPLSENSPPFCVSPPNTPSTTIPTPIGFTPLSPPYNYPSPLLPPPTPTSTVPGPPGSTMSPPYFEPSPPYYIPSPSGGIVPGPPTTVPSPSAGGGIFPGPPTTFPSPSGGGVPSPTVFQPPVVFPPPSVPPPPNTGPSITLWCVAKPSVPDPIMQEAMNYACGSGADCDSIQPNGPCFEPDTVYAHASYAFNSYWQKTRVAGGSCDFGGTAILVSVDPSYDGCHFVYF